MSPRTLGPRTLGPRTLGPRTLGPGLARLDVHAPLTPGGLALAVGWQGGRGPLSTELRWASRPWAGPGRGWPEHVGSAGMRWEGERVEWGAQLWRAGGDPAVNQGLVRAVVPVTTARATWRPALVVLASPEGWQSAALGLDWSARCACASWGVMASVAQDQPGLRLGASASLTPSSWGSSSRGASSPGSAPPGSLPLEQLDPRSPLQP